MTTTETRPETNGHTTPPPDEDTGGNLAAALAAAQAELPHVGKDNRATVKSDKGQYSYTYADLAGISAAVLPVLARHGLAWVTMPTMHGERFVLRYDLMHRSGESVGGWYPLRSDGTPQQMGSAITYARRYCLCAVTGVAPDDDDDGQAAQQQAREAPPRREEREEPRSAAPPAQRTREPEPEDSEADRRRRAAQMLDQVLAADTRDAAVNLWKLTKNAAYGQVDVSGLLDDHTRQALGVAEGERVSIAQAAAKAGAFVRNNERAVRPRRDEQQPTAGEPMEPSHAEADPYGGAEK